jgi:hypothetical protein
MKQKKAQHRRRPLYDEVRCDFSELGYGGGVGGQLFVMLLTAWRVSGFGIREERKETNKKRSRRGKKLGCSRAQFGYLIRDFDVRSAIPKSLEVGRLVVCVRVVHSGNKMLFRTLQGDEFPFGIQLSSFIVLNNSFLL